MVNAVLMRRQQKNKQGESESNMNMTSVIEGRLKNIEQIGDLQILFACESGSRAWGLASLDSDYDVRFIYKRAPRHYISLHPSPDVWTEPMEEKLDIVGWDITKALSLFQRSNPSLWEWLYSPIVYREQEQFVNTLRKWVPKQYSQKRLMMHYQQMAQKQYKSLLNGGGKAPAKLTLHLLRSLAVLRYMELHATLPFISLWETLEQIPEGERLKMVAQGLVSEKEAEKSSMGKAEDSPDRPCQIQAYLQDLLPLEPTYFLACIERLPDTQMEVTQLQELLWNELGL
ncbi:nucleotidyltransferase domain-containing protein [Brevibacillus laterosporus]|uniref:Nucleotidyltransferase domain-containing protein n=1 Tax=Brevibacillus laterosporus TaxID=1465 RepID=A0A518VE71_BRELA|nr:nucleotidyltransferase domain-containing protein [Brevibacillus laterosporus]